MSKRYPKSYHFSFSRGQIFFLSILLLLLCSLSFSLGIVLGYGMFASSLSQQLPKQEELKTNLEKSEEASFYETLPDNTPAPKSTPKPAALSSPSYQVQIGAFRQEKEARALQKRLQDKGYQVKVTKAQPKGKGVWFRVRVGNCANNAQARELAQKIKKQEHLPTLIVH